MAFTSNAQAAAPRTQGGYEKAKGFLNLYLPSKDGGRVKLGAIPLKESNTREKTMLDWLTADPTRVSAILGKLEIEYRDATPTEGSNFDLS